MTNAQTGCKHTWILEYPKNRPIRWLCSECGQWMNFLSEAGTGSKTYRPRRPPMLRGLSQPTP